MLTAFQCEIVAYALDGAILCHGCAVKRTSSVTVEKADAGLSHGFSDLSPWIRYTLDEYIGQNASEYADEEVGQWSHENAAEWDAAFESYPDWLYCDGCGAEIS